MSDAAYSMALQPVAARDDWVLLAGTRYANGA